MKFWVVLKYECDRKNTDFELSFKVKAASMKSAVEKAIELDDETFPRKRWSYQEAKRIV